MDKCTLTLEDCDVIVKKHFNTDDVITTNFTLLPLEGKNFELKLDIYHGQLIKTVSFFVKTVLNDSLINQATVSGFTPNLYLTKSNLAIYEDLRPQYFESHDGLLNLDELFFVLKVLAKFHATNFVLGEVKSAHYLDLSTSTVTNLLLSILNDAEHVSKIIEDLKLKQISPNFRTFCHGNLTGKNLMFRYENGAPTDCRLLNFKPNVHTTPIYDVLQLIFFNTSEDLRQQHFHALLDHYFQHLEEETKKSNRSISEEELQLSIHRYLPLVKLECALFNQSEVVLKDLEDILNCPLLSKEDCYLIVSNKLLTTNYKILSVTVTAVSDCSGFLGEYYKAEIKIIYLSEDTTIRCFIKSIPKRGIPMEIAHDVNSFAREVFTYKTLVQKMQKHGIYTINQCIPQCYFYRPQEFMVLEDMEFLGYENLDALKPLDVTTLTLLTQTLAEFHACSLILEEKLSMEQGIPYRLIDFYGEYFTEPLFFEDDKHKGALSFMTGIKSVLAAVEILTEIKTETNQRNFREFWPKLKELFYTVTKTSDRFRNVLCHGDLWTSNMMVQFQNGKPSKCVLIDFQIVRYCPPAYDLLSVLHLTTDRSTRLEHEDRLIQIYYDELRSVLNTYGLSVDSVYPYEDFIGCIKYMRPQMVLQAAIDCVLTMCTNEEISDFLRGEDKCRYVYFEDRTEFLTAMCEKSTLYRNRLKDCILDIYDYCNSMCTEC